MRLKLLALAIIVLATGCSSKPAPAGEVAPVPSGSPSPRAGASVTASSGPVDPGRAAFVKAANAACREYAAQVDALPDPEELDEYVPFVKRFTAAGAELQTKMRALPVPPKDAAAIDRYLDGNDAQDRILRDVLPKIEAAVRAEDIDEADALLFDEALEKFNVIADEQDPFARSYGLTDCASEPESETAT